MSDSSHPSYQELQRRLAETEVRQDHLNRVLRAIRNVNQLITRENDRTKLIQRACETLIATRGYHNAWIALLDETDTLIETAEAGLGKEFSLLSEELNGGELTQCARRALNRSDIVVIADPATACTECPLAAGYAGRAGMTARLAHEDRTYGILTASIPPHFARDEEEQGLFQEVAGDLGFALHKIETENQLRRLTHIVSSTPQPMSLVSPDYRYLAVNEAYASYYDVRSEHIVGCTVAELVGQEVFTSEIQPQLDRCLAGETFTYEIPVALGPKGRRWMRMEYSPYHDEGGQVAGVISHGLDITERKEMEEVLRERVKELQCLYAVSSDVQKDLPADEFCRRIVEHLLPATRYPELTAVMIELDGTRFNSSNYNEKLRHNLHADIKAGGLKRGALWVHYTEEKSFLIPQEQQLVDGVAKTLSMWLERRQAEAERSMHEAQYRDIYNASKDALLVFDLNGVIKEVNPAACELYGYSHEEMIGLTGKDIVQPEYQHLFREFVATASAERLFSAEAKHIRKDGSTFNVEVMGGDFTYKAESHLLAVVRDITEQKAAETELKRLNAELVAKNKELEQVLYATSHDLRSPLVNIQGFSKELIASIEDLATLVKQEGVPSRIREKCAPIVNDDIPESVHYILSSTAKMDALLSGLLTLSRLGEQKLSFKVLDMDGLMQEALSDFQFEIQEMSVGVHVSELPECRGDELQITQVFSNLIGNALKNLDPERPGVITISGRREHGRSYYTVEDNGVGIPPAQQKKIFDLFHKLDPKKPGIGLGLSIVRQILHIHDGAIELTSAPGQGTRFVVSLPGVP